MKSRIGFISAFVIVVATAVTMGIASLLGRLG